MVAVQNQLEVKFRLLDGSDIGPNTFPGASSITSLKESIISQWPKEKENGPKTVKDIKLISAGKILENNVTLSETVNPVVDVPGEITTMHVVIQPSSTDKDKKLAKHASHGKCGCVVM